MNLINPGSVRIARTSKKYEYGISGTMYVFKSISNKGTVSLVVHRTGVTGAQIEVYRKQGILCDFIQNDEDFYPHLMKASDLPEPQCPFPKVFNLFYIILLKIGIKFQNYYREIIP